MSIRKLINIVESQGNVLEEDRLDKEREYAEKYDIYLDDQEIGVPTEVVERLKNALAPNYSDLDIGDYFAWMYGGDYTGPGDYDKFHKAVQEFMGEDRVHDYEMMARLPFALEYQLGVPGAEKVVGGIDVSRESK